MRCRTQLPRILLGAILVLIMLCANVSAACTIDWDKLTKDQQTCTAGCAGSPNLIAQSDCVNKCNAAWSKTQDDYYACRNLEQQQADQANIEAEQAAQQKKLDEQRAERDREAEEASARDAGARWAGQGRPGEVWLGDDVDITSADAQLFRDGKVTPVPGSGILGPGDVISTGLGPVGVDSQVENIKYGANTIVQYISMKFNPPRIDAQPGDWDYARGYGITSEQEWTFLTGVATDLGTVITVSAGIAGTGITCIAAGVVPGAGYACGGLFLAYVSIGSLYIHDKMQSENGVDVVLTPSAAVAHEGTEFTINVAKNGTTTVTTLNGTVAVMDLASRKGVQLTANQAITVPKTTSGLTQQQLEQSIKSVKPETLNTWWVEKTPLSNSRLIQAVLAAVIIIVGVGLIMKSKKRKKNSRK